MPLSPLLLMTLAACGEEPAPPPPAGDDTAPVTADTAADTGPGATVDTGHGAADDPLAEDCAATPGVDDYDVTWENWGDSFFATWCRSCHSQTSPERYGAPEGMDFDTLEQVRGFRSLIWSSVMVSRTMPQGGGMDTDEYTLLAALLCGMEP